MTVYVDDWRQKARVGRITARWSHLFSDTSDEELHAFADRIGLQRAWFQKPDAKLQTHRHYDVTDTYRDKAIAAGAQAITWREMGKLVSAERERRRQEASRG